MWSGYFFLFLGSTLVLPACQTDDPNRKKILSFGGNGNIGSEVLHRLIQDGNYDITLVSRGKWHFDSAERVKPFVKNVICDRSKEAKCAHEKDCEINTLKNCTDLMKVINATETFHAVLDFSAFEAKWVHDAVHALKDKVRVYVYISTDSVYEVSEAKPSKRASLETDAKRPNDINKRKELKKADRYGDAKLSGEEALAYHREEKDGFPWIALRFADVIGPRDTSDRWLLYHLWVKFFHSIEVPIYVPPIVMGLEQSMTFNHDAAQAIILAMETQPENWNQAYNVAMEEPTTLWDTVQKIAELLEVPDLKQNNEFNEKLFHLYPTVYNGPVDISKAKDKLAFKPTPLHDAFKITVEWYEEAFVNQTKMREEMLSKMITDIVPRGKKDQLYVAVESELEKHGIVNEKYRKKKKGDIGNLEHEEL